MLIPDSEEQYPGAQTFVNLDNDDCDAHFDREDDIVQNGDNEFIKIHLFFTIKQLQRPGRGAETTAERGPGDYQAALDLAGNTSISGVRLWKSADKSAGEYMTGDPLELTPTGLTDYEAWLWAEGTEAHTLQQQVQFLSRFYEDPEPICTGDVVSITVVGVDKMEWIGVENGFTGDGKNNSNILDPNVMGNPDAGVRVFPEKKSPDKNAPSMNSVKLEITMSVDPPASQSIYLRPFDLDDPTNTGESDPNYLLFVDPNDGGPDGMDGVYVGAPTTAQQLSYTKDNDNRGAATIPVTTGNLAGSANLLPKKEGKIAGISDEDANGIYEKTNLSSKTWNVTFYVSQFCGDSYKVALHNDHQFLVNTRNRDKFDGPNIVDVCTAQPSGNCTPISASLTSPALTVWRTLHIEYDRMANPNLSDNSIINGYYRGFGGNHLNATDLLRGIVCTGCSTDPTVDPNSPLRDGSNSLDAGTLGRCSGGGIRVCTPPIELGSPNTNDIGNTSVIHKASSQAIRFTSNLDLTLGGTLSGHITIAGQPDLFFQISDIERLPSSDLRVHITSTIPTLELYNGGNISIGGGPIENGIVMSTMPDDLSFTIPSGNLKIPVEVRDDDDIPLAGVSNDIMPASFFEAEIAYSKVYINIINDGGGNLANNSDNIPFYRNVQEFELDDPIHYDQYSAKSYKDYNNKNTIRQSVDYGSNNYWIIYALSAWQSNTGSDADPISEGGVVGQAMGGTVSDCELAEGTDFLALFHSSHKEISAINPAITLSFTIAHEIGHCLGLSHGDVYFPGSAIPNSCLGVNYSPAMLLMAAGEFSIGSLDIIPYQINLLRSRSANPKHKF